MIYIILIGTSDFTVPGWPTRGLNPFLGWPMPAVATRPPAQRSWNSDCCIMRTGFQLDLTDLTGLESSCWFAQGLDIFEASGEPHVLEGPALHVSDPKKNPPEEARKWQPMTAEYPSWLQNGTRALVGGGNTLTPCQELLFLSLGSSQLQGWQGSQHQDAQKGLSCWQERTQHTENLQEEVVQQRPAPKSALHQTRQDVRRWAWAMPWHGMMLAETRDAHESGIYRFVYIYIYIFCPSCASEAMAVSILGQATAP